MHIYDFILHDWYLPPDQGTGSRQLFPWILPGSLLSLFFEERASEVYGRVAGIEYVQESL